MALHAEPKQLPKFEVETLKQNANGAEIFIIETETLRSTCKVSQLSVTKAFAYILGGSGPQ
jgi:hypothetical protein